MISIRDEGKVRVIELARAQRRNALNLELISALDQAVKNAAEDGVRVAVITGEGTAFCAGADLDGVYGPEFLNALYSMLHGFADVPMIIIAAINGPAIGAGTQLALACDLRVADSSALFAIPTARNGMATDDWTIKTLAAIAGGGVARRFMLAAETFDADQALRCGLADRGGNLEEAVAWAQEIAQLAPLTLAYNKSVLTGADAETITAGFKRCWASEDVQEGLTARTEKRPPIFRGK